MLVTSAGFSPPCRNAKSLRQLDEIRVCVEDRVGVPFRKKQLLPLTNHAQAAIVDDGHLYRQPIGGHGGQFLHIHLKAAVSGNAKNRGVGTAHLGPQGCGKAKAHGTQASGGDQAAGVLKLIIEGGPHLMLAHLGGDDGLALCLAADLLDDFLGFDALGGGLVAEGFFRATLRFAPTTPSYLLLPGNPSECPERIRFTSPTMGISTLTFLPISAGSISAWMMRALGAKALSFPVTRSSKRAPTAKSRSASCRA
jgi:hypothetical protein